MPEPSIIEADTECRGIRMRGDPQQLPPGIGAAAVNMIFREGVPETRPGIILPGFLNKISSGINSWATIYGEGDFSDPVSGVEYKIIAADGNVYQQSGNNAPAALTLPAGITITSPVTFTQCFNVLVMHRGTTLGTLVMTNINTGFVAVTMSATGTGTRPIPNATRGLALANRLFVPNGDILWSSDLLDYTRGSFIDDFRINAGTADRLVTIAPFGKRTIVCLKGSSVHRVDNVYGDLSDVIGAETTRRFGCVAADSVVDTGQDLLWLSQFGIASMTLTEFGETQVRNGQLNKVPMLSDAIQPLIDRINWNYASGACSAFDDDLGYFALPIDQAEFVGPNLVETPRAVGLAEHYVKTTVGATYRLVFGNAYRADDGSTTMANTGGTVDYVATAAYLRIYFTGNYPTAQLYRVYKGNNVIAVYDFQKQEWAGHWTFECNIKKFFFAKVHGKRRLGFYSSDGWMSIFDRGAFMDYRHAPYVDVEITTLPAVGNTLRINGGTVITATADSTNHQGALTNWGCSTLLVARDNMQATIFYTTTWTCPDCIAVNITTGNQESAPPHGVQRIRFYATNGKAPTIATTGSWATVTPSAPQRAIEASWDSRAFPHVFGRNQAKALKVQLQTWNPTYTIATRGPQIESDSEQVSDKTRSRTVYDRPFNRQAWVATNANDDFMTSGRQDYSIAVGSTGIQSRSGFAVGLHQEIEHKVPVNRRGRYTQILISNTTGRIRVMGIGAEFVEADRRKGISL